MVKLRKNLWVWGGLIPVIIIIFDQLTKFWAINKFNAPQNICAVNPYPGLKIELSPIFDLALVCNQGVSFGMFSSSSTLTRTVLTLFAIAMCGFLLTWINKEKDKLMSFALALIIGGAIGNAIDRARFGAVTDFLSFDDIGFRWVFNVADSAITCGVIGLILAMILQDRAAKKSAKNTAKSP
ncbi:MAG: signal peptidase II [Robiginitomaculum sp.]|nr:signal peptidase II [Robiginitomaculum sp.]